jgi:hypothetical protein
MAYDESPYGGAAYGGDGQASSSPGQTLPPPIPGGTQIYYYASENGYYPYAYGGFAGARPQIVSMAGGLIVTPQPENGVVQIMGWWPASRYLHFLRLHDDGSRHPVRGGYGVDPDGVRRINYATNPSLEIGLNGFVPDVGSPTLTRITSASTHGAYALRATNAAAGSSGVTVPTTFAAGRTTATVAADLWFATRPTSLAFNISWVDSGGGSLGSTNTTLSANVINTAVSQWGRIVVQVTPPVGAVNNTFKIVAGGMPAAGTMDIDGITFEGDDTDASYFDGDTLASRWTGVVGLSTSDLSPITTVYDRDCPLDTPVRYLVANPSLTGGYVVSSTVELQSVGRWCWLTHPRFDAPIRCDLQSVPVLEHGIDQGIFYPIGRKRALVVSAKRHAPATQLIFNAVSFAERDTLLEFMSDGEPVLLRAPARYGYGPGVWWALGAVVEDREERHAYQDAMILTADAVEVDSPSPYQVAV